MLSNSRIAALTLTLTTGLIAAGCGANSSLSPTGPSIGTSSSGAVTSDLIASADEAAAPAGKGDHGRVDAEHGHQGDKDKDKDKDKGKGKESDKGKGVEVNGRITTIGPAPGTLLAGTLVIGTRHVSVPITATIRHGSKPVAFKDLKVGDHVEVKGSIIDMVLVASEVKVEQGGKNDDDEDGEEDDDGTEDGDLNEVELSCAVSTLAGSCPAALTFTVGKTVGTTVETTKVATTATTKFREIACAAIVNGTVVEVKGTRQADGSVVATRVSLED